MDRLTPEVRAMMEDAQKAATVLVQFEDGTQLDTCRQIRPSKLSDYFELSPCQSSPPVAQGSPVHDRPSASTPPSDGVFYKKATGWQQLETQTTAGENIHVNMFTMHGGANQIYRGAEAPIQLSDRRPVFYIKTTPEETIDGAVGTTERGQKYSDCYPQQEERSSRFAVGQEWIV
jgi:hypothetical protein